MTARRVRTAPFYRRFGLAGLIGLTVALAACDDGGWTITRVDKREPITLGTLWTLQDGQGLPVEIHGRPWRTTDIEIAEAIRPPAGTSQETVFYARPPGAWVGGVGHRMVLHFNPNGPPNAYHDCGYVTETQTRAPTETGFSVMVSLCKANAWSAQAFLEAPKVASGDMAAFTKLMQNVLTEMLKKED